MKSLHISILFPFLLIGCSSPSTMSVIDGITYTAKNEGGFRAPIRLKYPLQTTQVSLDGQLDYEVGDICLASRYRSPKTALCIKDALSKEDYKIEHAVYGQLTPKTASNASILQATSELDAKLVTLISRQIAVGECQNNADDKNTSSEQECETQTQVYTEAKVEADQAKATLQKALTQQNVRVYNWSDKYEVKGDVLVPVKGSANASVGGESSGYTIVDGFRTSTLHTHCLKKAKIKEIEKYSNSSYLKVVTKTMEAESIYFSASQAKFARIKAEYGQSLSDAQLAEIEMTLDMASNISSQGHLKRTKKSDDSSGLCMTYFAVLTDLSDMPTCKE
ncbi:hypothetical protein [Vibrio paucivorans]